jgi:hypothetical protein
LLANNRQAAKDRAMAQRNDEELGVIVRQQQEQMEILSRLKGAQTKLRCGARMAQASGLVLS